MNRIVMDTIMKHKGVLGGVAAVALLLGGVLGFWLKPSGVPRDEHDALVVAHSQLQAEAQTLQSNLNTAQQDNATLTATAETQKKQLDTLTQQAGTLSQETTQLKGTVAELETQVKSYETDRALLEQLKGFFGQASPFTPAPPATLFHVLEDGSLMFLQLDAPVTQATKLRYLGVGVPGKFCLDATYQTLAKEGYVHFRAQTAPNEATAGGGRPGEQGYWMKFIALGTFEMPWGVVQPGVDFNYRPTPPQPCPQ